MSCKCKSEVDKEPSLARQVEEIESTVERISRKIKELEEKFLVKKTSDKKDLLVFKDEK